jgi:hypothetical protein
MKFSLSIRYLFLLLLALLAFRDISFGQSDSAALAAADTTRFSVNGSEGWLLYNSYVVAHGTDSVELELVIRHDNNINWQEEHYIGKIKFEGLIPQTSQTIDYYLMSDQFAVRLDTTGKCYLKFVSGAVPSANPVVIPIRLIYKK